MASLTLKIRTPFQSAFGGEVDFVVVPSQMGVLGVLPRHAPLVAILEGGIVRCRIGSQQRFWEIEGGLVEIKNNVVTVFTEKISEVGKEHRRKT
ncbi:MAG: F0F1 ATP synthase subunit epsilon [bacterium]